MSKYLLQVSYTADGARGLLKDGGSKRRQVAEQAVKSAGGSMEAFYFAFGDTDALPRVGGCRGAGDQRERLRELQDDRAPHSGGDRSGDEEERHLPRTRSVTVRSAMRRVLASVCLLLSISMAGVHAQWLNFPTPGVPRTRDGKPNLTAPAPRAADGKPDLSGVWMHELISAAEMKRLFGPIIEEAIKVDVPGMEIGTQHRYAFNILMDFKPAEAPMRPEAVEKLQKAFGQDPSDVCGTPAGIPLASLLSEPIKIVQSPRLSMIVHESDNTFRQIYTDGRVLPKAFDFPAFMGYSVGRWVGDTLVVDSAGFNDRTPLDVIGHAHSDALRIVERYSRRDFGHMDVEWTFDDPKLYTKPFTIKVPFDLLADADIFESFCHENEKDRAHLAPK
jgi:GYD domain